MVLHLNFFFFIVALWCWSVHLKMPMGSEGGEQGNQDEKSSAFFRPKKDERIEEKKSILDGQQPLPSLWHRQKKWGGVPNRQNEEMEGG
mmetsp:Transcript_39792/g.78448  ORF Transcript_39792/g.78448 Transcript_39792/m.78448 type:complete len:89 (+) Transcript_39792:625-891(+)